MGRNYTVAHYTELLERIRRRVPGSSIASDVIVGFPGESPEQFQGTVDLLSSARFDAVHIAKYSPRAGTPASRLPDDVPPEEKERRRTILEELQSGIVHASNQSLLSQSVQVLVEDPQRGRWKGRTPNNKLVFFEDERDWRGRLAQVRITWAGAWSLRGKTEP
jgi:tRNA-2-methylthio-N6-dimethylallyladenosine synthase